MAKRKLLIKDKEEILKIIAKFLDNKELKELKDKLAKKQEKFKEEITEEYIKTFKITKELLDFANKYNIKSKSYLSFNGYNEGEVFNIFSSTKLYTDDFMRTYYTFDYEIDFPYYDRLSYVTFGESDITTNNYIRDKYKKYIIEICNELHNKSKEIVKIYRDIKNIINSSDYVEDFENIIEIQEVTDFINQRFINKKSTALCAINKEKIDFVKNYLTSLK